MIEKLDNPGLVKELTDCYRAIDYFYEMAQIAESKRDALTLKMSFNDIRVAIKRSSKEK